MRPQLPCKIELIILGSGERVSQDGILQAGFARTPFGTCLIAESSKGLAHLSFIIAEKKTAWEALQKEWPSVILTRSDAGAARLAKRIFTPNKRALKIRILVRGTDFQIRVWKELVKIPFGHRISYGALAKAAGKPKAVRAAASAVGKNSVAFLIPCHRVVRENGDLGGYRWGKVRKQAILTWENRNKDNPS